MKKSEEKSYGLIGVLSGISFGMMLDGLVFHTPGVSVIICMFIGTIIGGVLDEAKFLKKVLGKINKYIRK